MKMNILLLCFIMLSCSAKSNKKVLTLTGSSTIAPIALELGKAFEKENPNISVEVQTGGSSRGVSDARKGLADIGMVSRALKTSETDLQAHTFALDGIGVIVHKSNKVERLSHSQIIDIYKKKTHNWKDLGGNDSNIVVVNKAEGRSTLELFLKYLQIKNSEIKADVVIGDNEHAIKSVLASPTAIAYVSIGTAQHYIEENADLKLIQLDGKESSLGEIKKGNYPIIRKLNFVTKGELNPIKSKFLKFISTQKGTEIVKSLRFIPMEN